MEESKTVENSTVTEEMNEIAQDLAMAQSGCMPFLNPADAVLQGKGNFFTTSSPHFFVTPNVPGTYLVQIIPFNVNGQNIGVIYGGVVGGGRRFDYSGLAAVVTCWRVYDTNPAVEYIYR